MLNVCIPNWDAKSNKTTDFLYKKFILKHFLAVMFFYHLLFQRNLQQAQLFL